jgi:hypothetical protein
MKKLYSFCLLIVFICATTFCRAQSLNPQAGVTKLVNQADAFFGAIPSEKLYLQTDKPYYNVTDTLWFKAYVFNAALLPSKQSAKLYIELINDSSKLVKRVIIPIYDGLGNGDILLEKTMRPGTYTMRAYTNWMQNFSPDLFFSKVLNVGGAGANSMLFINERHDVKQTANGAQVNLTVNLSNAKKAALPYHEVDLVITSANKQVFGKKFTTSDAGNRNATFTINPAAVKSDMQLTVIDKTTGLKHTLPIIIETDNTGVDVQFFPEGGSMVAGIYNKIAFKAINTTGYGEAVNGAIKNNKNEVITEVRSLHNGMGSFMLLPQAGEHYYAALRTASGKELNVELPLAKAAGTSLRVDNLSIPDSISLFITARLDTAMLKKPYSLIAELKDQVIFGAPVKLTPGFFNLKIPKSKFTTGIAAFTLLDDNNRPLNQRRIFIDRDDSLSVELLPNKSTFSPKDSIEIALTVTNELGEPVKGSFSATVTDDGFIKNDDNANNIKSQMLLTAEIKGYIESPGWYFYSVVPSKQKALDNLLLTQGWTGYDWASPPAVSKPKFEAEPDNRIVGKLESMFKRPVKGAKVRLFASSKKYGIVAIDTTSNDLGRFVFNDLPFFDTIAYTIKVHNKKDKEMGAGIIVDEFKPAAITALKNTPDETPWFTSSIDTVMLKYFDKPTTLASLNQQPLNFRNRVLKEVLIKGKKEMVKMGFQNNFEYGAVIRELNEADLIAAKKRSLLSLILEKFQNFRIASYYSDNSMAKGRLHEGLDIVQRRVIVSNYVLGTRYIYDVFVDNQSVQAAHGSRVTNDSTSYYYFLTTFLESVGADDIKEVKISEGFHTFMTITTRSGAGLFASFVPGILACRPLPLTLPREFYKPRYSVTNTFADTRTTINWEPNIITDDNGKAKIWFYAADKPAIYTLKLEGTDLQGRVGSQTSKITIAGKAAAGE